MLIIATVAVVGWVGWVIASLAFGSEAGKIVLLTAYGVDAAALIGAFLLPNRSRKPEHCYLP